MTRFRFPKHMRLAGGRLFQAVYNAKMRVHAGPIVVHALPNELGHSRVGLSVSRQVGNAVVRNLIKRRLREAFRLLQHQSPFVKDESSSTNSLSRGGYDLIIKVKPHEPLELAEYQQRLMKAASSLHSTWIKKRSTQSKE